ncbi:phage portal protein [Eggerthia catenaformis]|nr:phage portal protein [Eggerthia catenaformis]
MARRSIIKSIGAWLFDLFDFSNLSTAVLERDRIKINFCDLAIDRGASIVGRNLAKCEFKFKNGGKETKGEEWYKWNIRPNKNETASYFKKRIAYELIKNGECLIIRNNQNDYLIADNYTLNQEHANTVNYFENVIVKDYCFKYGFSINQVIFIKIEDERQQDLINAVVTGYGNILNHAVSSFNKSYLRKMKVKLKATFTNDQKNEEIINDIFNDKMKTFMSDRDAVIPEYEGAEYEDFGTTSSTISSNEILAIRKDMFDMVANVLGIPQSLLEGDTTDLDSDINEFITNCFQPILCEIENAINFALYQKEEILKGDGMTIDIKKLRTIDIFKQAGNIDKLISSGYMSIDEVRERTDLEVLNEEFSSKHYITKNYATSDQMLEDK